MRRDFARQLLVRPAGLGSGALPARKIGLSHVFSFSSGVGRAIVQTGSSQRFRALGQGCAPPRGLGLASSGRVRGRDACFSVSFFPNWLTLWPDGCLTWGFAGTLCGSVVVIDVWPEDEAVVPGLLSADRSLHA